MVDKDFINVNLVEVIALNQIRLKNYRLMLENGDRYLSILKRFKNLSSDTPVEELDIILTQLRAILNKLEDEIKNLERDKNYVQNIIDRENNGTNRV